MRCRTEQARIDRQCAMLSLAGSQNLRQSGRFTEPLPDNNHLVVGVFGLIIVGLFSADEDVRKKRAISGLAESTLTELEKQIILDEHNDYRRQEGAADMEFMVSVKCFGLGTLK